MIIGKSEVAEKLNGMEYGARFDLLLLEAAKENRIVIVYGASDDLMEFEGAICDELGAWGGTIAYLNHEGLLQNHCDSDDCPHFAKLKESAKTIAAKWNDEGPYSWTFETTIPHKTFDIVEGGEPYCRGIVFDLDDLQ